MFELRSSGFFQESVTDVVATSDLPKDVGGSETDADATVDDQLIPLLPVGERMFQDVENSAMLDVACANVVGVDKKPVSLFDLLHTLQKHRKLIPSHTVYSLNMERLLSRLNHPGRDD